MLRVILISLYFVMAGLFQSKDLPERSNTYTIYINFENYSVRANVLYEANKVKTKMGHTYYWYVNNDIKTTDGSFDGKLLHGEYKSFYRNLNLREQGNFTYGLKNGGWKTWYLNGKIHEIINYKDGLVQGLQELYDEEGNIVSKTAFKNGMKDGKMISYQKGKIDTVIIYKKGQALSTKSTKSKLKSSKSNLQLKNNKQKDSTENASIKTHEAKDTIVTTPKSSFSLKNVFNKKEKKKAKGKSEIKKKTRTKKKYNSADSVSSKKH